MKAKDTLSWIIRLLLIILTYSKLNFYFSISNKKHKIYFNNFKKRDQIFPAFYISEIQSPANVLRELDRF